MASDDETQKAQPSTSETPKDQTKDLDKDQTKTANPSADATSSASALEVAEQKTTVASDEYIRLRVITSDLTNEVHFRVKSATALVRLKRSYCSKLGFQVEELRFVFDGHRITDDDTPKSLGMINDDVIEIYQERTGGHYK